MPQRTQSNSFFDVLRSCTENSSHGSPESQGLRDILLRDTASRIVETDAESLQLVMHNLSLFIDKVHDGAYDPGLVRRKSHQHLFRCFPDARLRRSTLPRKCSSSHGLMSIS